MGSCLNSKLDEIEAFCISSSDIPFLPLDRVEQKNKIICKYICSFLTKGLRSRLYCWKNKLTAVLKRKRAREKYCSVFLLLWRWLFLLYFIYILIICVREGVAMVYAYARGQLLGVSPLRTLFESQVVRLGSKCLNPLSHFISPILIGFIIIVCDVYECGYINIPHICVEVRRQLLRDTFLFPLWCPVMEYRWPGLCWKDFYPILPSCHMPFSFFYGSCLFFGWIRPWKLHVSLFYDLWIVFVCLFSWRQVSLNVQSI